MTADVQIAIPSWLEKPGTLRRPLLEGAERAMTNTLVKHFRQKDRAEPNAKGWARSHWWNRVASSVTSRIEGESAVADIREPGALLHWKGGTVRPRPGRKALAIPADPSVAGVWPSERGREDTFAFWPKGKAYGFIAEKGGKPLHVLWWLVGATHHAPDPGVIPEEELHAAVDKACQHVASALRKGGKA